MGKLILLLSLLGTTMLFCLGLVSPGNPIMLLASTELDYAFIRLVMMLVLASLLATHPPRKVLLRMLVGAFAISLAGWSLVGFYNNQVAILDLLSMLQFSIATGLIVLESKYVALENPQTEEERIIAARNARTYLLTSSFKPGR